MKKRILSLWLMLMLVLTGALLSACDLFGLKDDSGGGGGGSGSSHVSDDQDPALENEDDGAELVMVAHDSKDFAGKWSIVSEHAEFLYGNVDLKINESGTWSGNITDERYAGTWTYRDGAVILKDTSGLINWKLYFVEDGSLVFQDNDDPDMTPLVLKKK